MAFHFFYRKLFAGFCIMGSLVACGQHMAGDAHVKAVLHQSVQLGDKKVILSPTCKTPIHGIWFVHVHEDEKTATSAAIEFIDSIGFGCFVTLQHGSGRNISFTQNGVSYTFDPNRMFTDAGRKATLQKLGKYSESAFKDVTRLAKKFTSNYIDSNKLIVALHNNTNDGGLTIKSYAKGGDYASDASQVFINQKEDVDDFFYTTSEKAFSFFKELGFNVMQQNNATVTDDGSLSVYAGLRKIDYINIEAEHGKAGQQKRMLLATIQYIETFYPVPASIVLPDQH
jgi:hypothetical protein